MTIREVVPFPGEGIAPISAAVRWGDLLFASGIAPVDPVTGALLADGIEAQCDAALGILADLLARCGAGLTDVLRVECFLAEPAFFPAWNASFARHFPHAPPARTTLVCGFALPGMLVEIQATCGLRLARAAGAGTVRAGVASSREPAAYPAGDPGLGRPRRSAWPAP